MKGLIIGYNVEHLIDAETIEEHNTFGTVQGVLHKNLKIVYRHGKQHQHLPHELDYRAHVWALKDSEVVFAVYAMGIANTYKPGDVILLKDFVSFLPYKPFPQRPTPHYAVNPAFDERWTEKTLNTALKHGHNWKTGGIAHTITGPRFETSAEVQILSKLGVNLLSMTCGFEIPLLHELSIPVVGIAIATNYGAGIEGHQPTQREVEEMMKHKVAEVLYVVKAMD
jgi:purine nucleoside phosphorylase